VSNTVGYVVAIVVDPAFGERVAALLDRMPVWIADTETNRTAVARVRPSGVGSGGSVDHTESGALTTFTVDLERSPESWCLDILDTVAGHHDRYSYSPGYSALEVYGAAPSPHLLEALAEYGLTEMEPVAEGFRASPNDGREAGSPNDT
jgi:hypothetical protein